MDRDAIRYPRLVKRVRAVLVDSIVMPLCAIGTLLLGTSLGVSAPLAKFALLAGPVLVLDPVLVALTGATIGHRVMGLQITRLDGTRRLGILRAIVRFAIKLALGWTSFILVLTTRRHQALHDLVARSIVTYRDPSRVAPHERLAARTQEGFRLPHCALRLAVIALYLAAHFAAVTLVSQQLTSQACFEINQCKPLETLVMVATSVLLLIGAGAIIVLGWNGRLFGARRRAVS